MKNGENNMKIICKLTIVTFTLTLFFTAVDLQAQDDKKTEIGLTVGLDYVSNYIHRGMYYYSNNKNNSGMFSPYAFYNVFNTGLSLGIKREMAEAWVWDNKDETRDVIRINVWNSTDFNINYMYDLKEKVTFNLGGWYYRHRKMHFDTFSINISYFDIYFSATIDALPLKPMFSVTYSYFTDKDYVRGWGGEHYNIWGAGFGKNDDLYAQIGVSHSFLLFDLTFFDLGAIAGFYNKKAYDYRISADNFRKPIDLSDIDLSSGISTTSGMLTFSTSFHYVIVPGTQHKYVVLDDEMNPFIKTFIKDIHKFYAKFGVSCSI